MPSATATVTMTLRPPSIGTNGYTNGARKFRLDPIPEALATFQKGEFLVVVDDESRENEGDLIIAANHITTQKMAWFIKHTSCASSFILLQISNRRFHLCVVLCSGYICISLPGDRCDELQLPPMVPNNEEKHRTAYTVTVDYKYGM